MQRSVRAFAVVVATMLATTLFVNSADAQTAKDLVGAWMFVSNVSEQGGVKSEPFGANPQGILIFEASGRYALIIGREGLPKFTSNNRTTGNSDENKAIVQGSIAHYGTYTVDEADKTITFKIESSTYPNFNKTEQKRPLTLTGDELKYVVTAFSGGGTAAVILKRAK